MLCELSFYITLIGSFPKPFEDGVVGIVEEFEVEEGVEFFGHDVGVEC